LHNPDRAGSSLAMKTSIPKIASWVAIVALALLSGAFGLRWASAKREAEMVRREVELAELETRNLQQRLEAERILAQRQMESLSTTGDLTLLRLAKLTPPNDDTRLVALGVWNPATQHGLLVVEQLPPPAAEQLYHVWVVDASSGHSVRAGTFTTSGGGAVRVDLQPVQPVTQALELRITSEKASGVSRPRGAVIAAGKL
jgi:hypothetical protein